MLRWCKVDDRAHDEPDRPKETPQKEKEQKTDIKHAVPSDFSPPLSVFTDGSCIANGTRHARAGYAVVFPDHHPRHTEARAMVAGKGQPPVTNNRAELMGCIRAFEIARDAIDPSYSRNLVIYTDSQLMIDSITKWLPGWKRRGWVKADGKTPVLNRDLLERLDRLREERGAHRTVFRHVRAHTGKENWESQMNALADRLAQEAATQLNDTNA